MTSRKQGRRYYLTDIPLDQALEKFFGALDPAGALAPLPPESVPLRHARGRVTAAPVWAKLSSPHYDSSAMDGAAVRSRDTVGATETSPVRLTIGEQAAWLDTGDPLPSGYDAVVMVEDIHEVDASTIEILSPVAPYQHIRTLGEDIAATELLLPENHLLRPVDLGACAAAGIAYVDVRRRPTVAIIPTGNELVPVGQPPAPGKIIEFNSLVLGGLIEEWGGCPTTCDPVPDDPSLLLDAVACAMETYDVVAVNAGSSAGAEDYTARVVEQLGTLLVHGVAVRPGHPVVLGVIQGKPVLGIPGYPVSAALTAELFLKPLLERMLGVKVPERPRVSATITRKVLSPTGEDEFLRVGLGRVGERLVATPIQRGAGVITSLVRADGLVLIPRFTEGLDAGRQVSVELLRPLEQVENAIVAIGSHDVSLDLLASHLSRSIPPRSLSSSNVGSLGGLLALSRKEAHFAGCHLLDEVTGEYNVAFVQRYLKGHSTVLVNLAHRVQGLIVPPGNPKSVSRLEDLARTDVSFINRQRGSGTRVLLDYKLRELSLAPECITGYQREEYTHLAVAAAVAGGSADAGLGVLAAARALGMDFVPLLTERFDLAIPAEFYERAILRPLLDLLYSTQFIDDMENLGGYDTSQTGQVIARIG